MWTPYNHRWYNKKYALGNGIFTLLNARQDKLTGAFFVIVFSAHVSILCAMFFVAAELDRNVLRKSKRQSSHFLKQKMYPPFSVYEVAYLIWPPASLKDWGVL